MSEFLGKRDYHIHTVNSACGHVGMEPTRVIRLYEKLGFESIGFCDHYIKGAYKPIVDQVRAQVESTPSKVKAFVGTETCVRSPTEATITREEAAELDFVIAAPHHMVNPVGGSDATVEALRDELWGHFLFACAQDWVNAVAHPFHMGPEWHPRMKDALAAITDEMLGHAFDAARRNRVAMELQPKAFGMEPEFRTRFFSLAIRVGVRIWIGSDTHSIPRIGATGQLLPLVREFGITEEMVADLVEPGS